MSDDVEGDLVARRVIRYRKAVYASSLHIGAATDGVLDPAVHNWIGWGDGLPYPSRNRDTPFPDLPVPTRPCSNLLLPHAATVALELRLLPQYVRSVDRRSTVRIVM